MRTRVNGQKVNHISIHDRGWMYGDGLYETCAVLEGAVCLWEEHKERMLNGCKKLLLTLPDFTALENDIAAVCGNDTGVLKITITRGEGTRGYRFDATSENTRVVQFSEWNPPPQEYYQHGINAQVCAKALATDSVLAGLKHLNRLENVMAAAELREDSAEGLLFDADNNLIEGTKSNVFLVYNQSLYTPKLHRCGIEGVMRNKLINIARAENIDVQITTIAKSSIQEADEVFVCNSLIGLWPVRQVDNYVLPTTKLSQQLLTKISDISLARVVL